MGSNSNHCRRYLPLWNVIALQISDGLPDAAGTTCTCIMPDADEPNMNANMLGLAVLLSVLHGAAAARIVQSLLGTFISSITETLRHVCQVQG